ncbi:MAG TPA: S41 family peptidase [Candidatus Hydrogenedentes bacterium]|nr:hypothetical protein [Candidatus Hydrogenedentota bacterium]HOK89259.1 S41 family peptidase [Candidatus Hydrogenedentota bacterium]HOV59684.1 S41 family peptidase [Candidatus Hydrogenedentota bacterium]
MGHIIRTSGSREEGRVSEGIRGILLVLCCLLSLTGCETFRARAQGMLKRFPFERDARQWTRPGDFRDLTWTEAFNALHAKFSREYALGEWKQVPWESLYSRYAMLIADAQAREDQRAYYIALRRYLHEIPDGYVRVSDEPQWRLEAIGGWYGLSVVPLEEDTLFVYRVDPGRSAAKAGIRWGARIVSWNGHDTRAALSSAPVWWVDAPAATWAGRMLDQCMVLTRGPVGGSVTVEYVNPGESIKRSAQLTAESDDFAAMRDVVNYARDFSMLQEPFTLRFEERDGQKYAVLAIYVQSATLNVPFPDRAFKRIIDRINRESPRGLVLDLRGDSGGSLELALEFAAHFVREPRTLARVVRYDDTRGGFMLDDREPVRVEPRDPRYEGPVCVLVHRSTRDTGQVIALAIQGQSNVRVVGVMGGDGSWAVPGGLIHMPGDYVVEYPVGRYVDEQGNVVACARGDLEGGLTPDITIPAEPELLAQEFKNQRDSLLEQALKLLGGNFAGN